MMFTNPYQAYQEGSVLAPQSPVQLIIALYEGGISAVQEAKSCLEGRDIMGRAKAISKGVKILAELQISLNRDTPETQQMTAKLARLYGYMTQRLHEANLKQVSQPLDEVEGLFRTMVDGWYEVAKKEREAAAALQLNDVAEPPVVEGDDDVLRITYGGYYREPIESYSALSVSF